MLIGMFLLYPLIRKYKENFTLLIAPCIVIFGYAYLYRTCGGIDSPGKWFGITNCGTLRGIIGLCVGCVSYEICNAIQRAEIEKCKAKAGLCSALELLAYFFVLFWTFHFRSSKFDFVVILAMAVGVTLTFTRITAAGKLLDRPVCSMLGKYSLSIYLGHCYYSLTLLGMFPDWSYKKLLVLYLGLTLVTSFVITASASVLRKAVAARSVSAEKIKD